MKRFQSSRKTRSPTEDIILPQKRFLPSTMNIIERADATFEKPIILESAIIDHLAALLEKLKTVRNRGLRRNALDTYI